MLGLLAWNPLVSVIAFLSLLTGWGFPVSAAVRRNPVIYQEECWPLDKASVWLVNRMFGQYYPHAYGVTWLTLHGAYFGAHLAIGLGSPVFLLLAGMGLCYAFCRDIEEGEMVHGVLWGLVIFIFVLQNH